MVAVRAIGRMPGTGKTALAVHAAYLPREELPDRQLFIKLARPHAREHDVPANAVTQRRTRARRTRQRGQPTGPDEPGLYREARSPAGFRGSGAGNGG